MLKIVDLSVSVLHALSLGFVRVVELVPRLQGSKGRYFGR